MKNKKISPLDRLKRVAPFMNATCEEIIYALESLEVPEETQGDFCGIFTFEDVQKVSRARVNGREDARTRVEEILKEKGLLKPAFA